VTGAVCCATSKKIVGGACVACGKCETCDGTAKVTANKCTADALKPFKDAGVCKACPAKHTCEDKCNSVACASGKKIVGGKCVACGLCENCDGSKTTTKKECGAANQYRHTDGTCKACPEGFTCTDKCSKTCAKTKKVVGGKCVDCGLCETCDGTATVVPKLCAVGQYRAADGTCTKCGTGNTCDRCKQTLKAVVCPLTGISTPTCTACPTGYKCDGKAAVALLTSVTTAKPKATAKPKETTPDTMSDAEAWSTAIPLFITAFAAIVV